MMIIILSHFFCDRELMNRLGSFLSNMNESSACVTIGATKGIIVKQDEQEIDEISEVSVGYGCRENNDMLVSVHIMIRPCAFM